MKTIFYIINNLDFKKAHLLIMQCENFELNQSFNETNLQ